MSRIRWLTVFVLALGLSSVQSSARAQEADEAEEGETKNDIGVFVGALSNLETNETGPGVGFDYTREVTDKLGFVVFAEWANAGEREAAFGGGLEWRPGGGIKLILAPGVILERTDEDETSDGDNGAGDSSRETLFFFRTGVGYEFEVSNVPLTPTLYFDIVDAEDGVDAHLVYGLTISIPF